MKRWLPGLLFLLYLFSLSVGCGGPAPALSTEFQPLGTVGKDGGKVCATDGPCVEVQAGMLKDGQTVKLSAREVTTTSTTQGIVGKIFELKAEYSDSSVKANSFNQPVVVSLPLPDASKGKDVSMATFKETPKGRGGIWSRVTARGGIWSRDPKNAGRGGIWSSVPSVTDGKSVSANTKTFSLWTVVELCPEGQTRCFGTCVKDDNPTRCCDDKTACPTGGTCSKNRCTCPDKQVICEDDKGNDACIDIASDKNNCGACGKVCKSGEACVNSACVDASCTGDKDKDGIPDCKDKCPEDGKKIEPGVCGCGTPDTDEDKDGTPDCKDKCPKDGGKTEPGICGCGNPDVDKDRDGTPTCKDKCPEDPFKTEPGVCGCNQQDKDSDKDGTLDCKDKCPNDRKKTEPGTCGCGFDDTDTDKDGTPDCNDACPDDPKKTTPGVCGCGKVEDVKDVDKDGLVNCLDPRPFVGCSCFSLSDLKKQLQNSKFKCLLNDSKATGVQSEIFSGVRAPLTLGLANVVGIVQETMGDLVLSCVKGCVGANRDTCRKINEPVGKYSRLSLMGYYACQDVVKAACSTPPPKPPAP